MRFIEFMKITPLWKDDYFIPIEEVRKTCERRYNLERIGNIGSGPALYYGIKGDGILGFIKTDKKTCMVCSRLRLTASGEFMICLYETGGLHLKNLLRMGVCDEEIRDILKAEIEMKKDADYSKYESPKLYMSNIGG